jgi:hypothetical protein
MANEDAVQPALRKLAEADKMFFDAIDPQPVAGATIRPAPRVAEKAAPVVVARQAPHRVQKTIVSTPPRPAVAGTQPAPNRESRTPAMTLAPDRCRAKSAR